MCRPDKLSCLSLGTLHFGTYVDESTSTDLIRRAYDHGITHFDTAPMYGNGFSEEILGKAVKSFREKILISTKVGLIPSSAPDGKQFSKKHPLTSEYIEESVHLSLKKLGTDYLDVLQLHAFDNINPIDSIVSTVINLRESGKIRHIGCCNFSPIETSFLLDEIKKKGGESLFICQTHYNMIERRGGDAFASLCQNPEFYLVCNRGLASGLLSGKYKSNGPLPPGSRGALSAKIRGLLSPEKLNLVAKLASYAARNDTHLVVVALSWLLRQPSVSSVVVGIRDSVQLDQCLQSVSFQMSDDFRCHMDYIIETAGLMNMVRNSPANYFS